MSDIVTESMQIFLVYMHMHIHNQIQYVVGMSVEQHP